MLKIRQKWSLLSTLLYYLSAFYMPWLREFCTQVSDFGLSREEMVNRHASNIKGTLGYLDPEYVSSRSFTKKSDVYSYGVLLFELIAGRNPQQGLMEYVDLVSSLLFLFPLFFLKKTSFMLCYYFSSHPRDYWNQLKSFNWPCRPRSSLPWFLAKTFLMNSSTLFPLPNFIN